MTYIVDQYVHRDGQVRHLNDRDLAGGTPPLPFAASDELKLPGYPQRARSA